MTTKEYKLGQLLDVTRGASLSGEHYATEGKYIRLTLGHFDYINGGFKENTSKDNLFFTGNVKDEFILKKGNIITPLTEQTFGLIGSTALIPESDKYIQSQDIGLVTCNENLLYPGFCYYLLPTSIVKKQLSAGAQQTSIRHTSPDKIKDCKVFIPSLPEQRKIATFLSNLDKKIFLNRAMNKNLEALIADTTDYMFLSRKDNLGVVSIGDIASIKAGGDCPKDFSESQDNTHTIPIYSNGTDKEGLYGYTSQFVIEGRSVTVAARGTIGYCVRRYGKYVPIIRLLSVCPFDRGADTYLHQIISRMTFKKNGSVQQQLTVPELSIIQIPYPSKEELIEYDKRTYPLILQINHNKIEIQQLIKQRDELLPLLMNGQVSLNSDLRI